MHNEEVDDFEPAPPNTDVNFEEMAQNFFAQADEIHEHVSEDEDTFLDFEELSSTDEETDDTNVIDDLLQQSREPLYDGS